jgi:hypothetical protein
MQMKPAPMKQAWSISEDFGRREHLPMPLKTAMIQPRVSLSTAMMFVKDVFKLYEMMFETGNSNLNSEVPTSFGIPYPPFYRFYGCLQPVVEEQISSFTATMRRPYGRMNQDVVDERSTVQISTLGRAMVGVELYSRSPWRFNGSKRSTSQRIAVELTTRVPWFKPQPKDEHLNLTRIFKNLETYLGRTFLTEVSTESDSLEFSFTAGYSLRFAT